MQLSEWTDPRQITGYANMQPKKAIHQKRWKSSSPT